MLGKVKKIAFRKGWAVVVGILYVGKGPYDTTVPPHETATHTPAGATPTRHADTDTTHTTHTTALILLLFTERMERIIFGV